MSISLLTTCFPCFFVFIYSILPLFLSLYICLRVLLSFQKTATTNWRSNSLHARRMINDSYATVINPLNGFSSLSTFFLKALSPFSHHSETFVKLPQSPPSEIWLLFVLIFRVSWTIGNVRFHSPITKKKNTKMQQVPSRYWNMLQVGSQEVLGMNLVWVLRLI